MVYFFPTKSSKSSVYFILTAHLNSFTKFYVVEAKWRPIRTIVFNRKIFHIVSI